MAANPGQSAATAEIRSFFIVLRSWRHGRDSAGIAPNQQGILTTSFQIGV
jgi:hypothetical protein